MGAFSIPFLMVRVDNLVPIVIFVPWTQYCHVYPAAPCNERHSAYS